MEDAELKSVKEDATDAIFSEEDIENDEVCIAGMRGAVDASKGEILGFVSTSNAGKLKPTYLSVFLKGLDPGPVLATAAFPEVFEAEAEALAAADATVFFTLAMAPEAFALIFFAAEFTVEREGSVD